MWTERDLDQARSESSRYPLAAYPFNGPHDYREALAVARAEQAKAMGSGLAAMGRWLLSLLQRGVVAPIRRRRERAAAIHALRALSDAHLKDIGLTRGDIVAAVDGRYTPGGYAPSVPTWVTAADAEATPHARAAGTSRDRATAMRVGTRRRPVQPADTAPRPPDGREAHAG